MMSVIYVAGAVILIISLLYFIGNFVNPSGKIADLGAYCSLGFEASCLAAWAWTLIRLYRTVANAKDLLPNKKVFILHGSILSTYVIFYTVQITVLAYSSNGPQALTGISDLLLAFVDLLELLTFYMVVALMLPFQGIQRKKDQFSKFMHRGFVDLDQVETVLT